MQLDSPCNSDRTQVLAAFFVAGLDPNFLQSLQPQQPVASACDSRHIIAMCAATTGQAKCKKVINDAQLECREVWSGVEIEE